MRKADCAFCGEALKPEDDLICQECYDQTMDDNFELGEACGLDPEVCESCQ